MEAGRFRAGVCGTGAPLWAGQALLCPAIYATCSCSTSPRTATEPGSGIGFTPDLDGLRDPTARGGKWNEGSSQRVMASIEEVWRREVSQWAPSLEEPSRPFYRECYYLILFSGHRREGDIATQICLLEQDDPHVKLIPVCLDLCIDTTLGDLLCPVQQAKWFEMMKAGKLRQRVAASHGHYGITAFRGGLKPWTLLNCGNFAWATFCSTWRSCASLWRWSREGVRR